MTTKNNKRYLVMGFGFGGNHGDGIDNHGHVFSSTWYVRPDHFQSMIDNGHYSAAEMEGCILINKIPALDKDMSLSYQAPMVGVKLQDDESSRGADIFRDPISGLVAAAISEHNPTVALMAAKSLTDDSFIGLDKVSPRIAAEWWRSKGAVIGKVLAGKVIWETA